MNRSPLESYSPSDMLHQLIIPQYKDFLKDNSSVRYAVLAVILAYHMYEWVHQDKFTKEHFENHYSDEIDVDAMIELFEHARVMSNDLKHLIILTNPITVLIQSDHCSYLIRSPFLFNPITLRRRIR